jgi:hypothetical protein
MRNKNFDCVEMKRQVQERIYEATKHLTPEQRLAYHQRAFAELQARQEELRAQATLSALKR